MNMSILPCEFGVGDYRVILVNFNIDELIGRRVKIYSSSVRRLICENQSAVDKYNCRVVELIKFYNIKECLDNIESL